MDSTLVAYVLLPSAAADRLIVARRRKETSQRLTCMYEGDEPLSLGLSAEK
ncbi:hypothetical protein D3C83_304610 [compost metagenome]|jgi:hypothetical protein